LSAQPSPLRDLVHRYLEQSAPAHSSSYAAASKQALTKFLSIVEQCSGKAALNMPTTSIDTEWVRAFVSALQNDFSVETEHLYLRVFNSFLNYLVDHNLIKTNIEVLHNLLGERRPKSHTIPEPPVHQIQKMIGAASVFQIPVGPDVTERDQLIAARNKAFLLLLSETGFKVSEISNTRVRDLSLPSNTIHSKDITLPLTGLCIAALKTYLTSRSPLDSSQSLLPRGDLPLFARHDKRSGKSVLPLSRWTVAAIISFWVDYALSPDERAFLESSGQTITANSFRHFYVLNLIKETDDLHLVQSLSRHADPSTTRRYVSLLRGDSDQP
jgi:integrase